MTSPTLLALPNLAPTRRAVEWAVSASGGGRAVSVKLLRGGMSHANHAIRIESAGSIREVVLRRWVRPDWRETDPEFSPDQEAATYDLLASSAVPAPRFLAVDAEAHECDVPALLMTRAPGTRLVRPRDEAAFLAQLAGALPLIHCVDPDRARRTVPAFQPWYELDSLHVPEWTRLPSAWAGAIEVVRGPEPDEPKTFIHRDLYHGNTLWVDGRLTAIVDWTTTSWGPRSVDLAHTRLNLAFSFGVGTSDRFLDACREVGAADDLDPYWDLRDAVEFLPDMRPDLVSAAKLRRLDDFVVAALARLEGRRG